MSKSFVYAALATAILSGCADEPGPLEPAELTKASVVEGEPGGLTTVALGSGDLVFWPYTSAAINGPESDPINLIFPSRDPREVRASLLFLNGDRTAFGLPNAPPFNCVWKEAVGGAQVSYTQASGWTGSAIQLECGDYSMRFHLRLFPAGTATIANVHFEIVVPGTNAHEVLSWDRDELLSRVDFMRSGLLGSCARTRVVNARATSAAASRHHQPHTNKRTSNTAFSLPA